MGNTHFRPSRTRTRPASVATALLTIVLSALLTGGSSAWARTGDEPLPVLDPDDPNGAWAGYSAGGAGEVGHQQAPRSSIAGMDVSGHQGQVDWRKAWKDGARFTYVKATEGTTFRNDQFDQQYHGAFDVGMTRGAYHFALPDTSSGAEQARFFLEHGGRWTSDGRTLPGALDIETNPYGEECYGLTPPEMSAWIADFSRTYESASGRPPVIYTTTNWWQSCTGDDPHFGANPLWIARYDAEVGALPASWRSHSIWQFNDHGVYPGDQNAFNGDDKQFARFVE